MRIGPSNRIIRKKIGIGPEFEQCPCHFEIARHTGFEQYRSAILEPGVDIGSRCNRGTHVVNTATLNRIP